MTADELRRDDADRLLEISTSVLLEQQRQEDALEQEVADLVEQLRVVAGERGVGDLVGLFDGVRHDRPRRLLAIPRALAAQPLGQLLELDERFRERHEAESRSSSRCVVDAQGSGLGTKPTWYLIFEPEQKLFESAADPVGHRLVLVLLQQLLPDRVARPSSRASSTSA